MIVIYGLTNCDTIKKTKKWLDSQHIEYRFHDFRKNGLSKEALTKWIATVGWETLVNRRGTTWRNLPDAVKETLNETQAIELMLQHPSLIKRPVLEMEHTIHVGFKDTDYARIFGTE